jgi:hypothetical protein
MRSLFGPLAFLVLALPASAVEVSVRVTDGRVDLSATAAPIADVLDRLSKQTGMKVVYEGPAPRQLVTVSLHGRSPAEAVLGLLEGQGLNYILIGDASGDRVQTLMMAGAAPVASSRPAASSPIGRGMASPPPASGPEADEPIEEPEPEEEPEQAPTALPPNGLPQMPQIPGAGPNPGMPMIPGMPPGTNMPGTNTPGANTPGANPLPFSIPGLPNFPGSASSPMPFGPQPFPGGQKPPQPGQNGETPP